MTPPPALAVAEALPAVPRHVRVGPRWLPSFRVQLGLAAACAALFILWSREGWFGEQATVVFADTASTLVPAAAAWACWERSRHAPASLVMAWRMLAAATLSWSLGQAYWTYVELTTGQPPATPSWADAGYILLLPLAAIGVTALVRRHRDRMDPRPIVDGAIIGSSFIFVAFAGGLERILLGSEQTLSGLVVNLLYPFGDAVVLGIVLTRLSRAPAHARGAIALLAAGFTLLAVADLWFLIVDAQGQYSTGGILDAFWIMGFQCIGLAAIRPANLDAAVDAPAESRALALVPLYPFFVALLVGMYAEIEAGYFSDTLYWTALVVVALVVLRLVVMVFDNIRLTASLRAAEAERRTMLNGITHDLLNPLTAVRLQLRLLGSDKLGPQTPPQAKALHLLDRNVDRVHRLSSDLKDLVNLETKGLVIVPRPFDLAAEGRRAVQSCEADAAERGVALAIDAPPSAQMVGDAGRIGQVLDNLLCNALKFTPAGGRVELSVRSEDGGWSASVADSGRGLTPQEAGRLFQAFSQVHEVGEVKEAGTGLGLFICRNLAALHGGTLTVQSPGRGKGSTFRLWLPAEPPAKAAAAGAAAS